MTLKQYLIEERFLTEADEMRIEQEVIAAIAAAVEEAEKASAPDDPFSHVYARVIEPGPAVTAPEPEPKGQEVNLITAINLAIHDVMAAHGDTVIFGEDVGGKKGGVFKATQGVTDNFGDARCFNTPISESLIAGAAIGMAAAGKRPIAEIQFADYIHPAFDQIVSEAARIHYRSNGRWSCPIVIRVPYGGGIHGALYHSQSIEALYAHIPGLKVVVPSTPADVKGLLMSAVEDPDPVLFLEPKKLYRLAKAPIRKASGEFRSARPPSVTPEQTSPSSVMAPWLTSRLEAVEPLADLGVSIEVIDLRSIKPLDWATIEASVKKTSRVLIVHEDNEFVGYGAELAAQVADKTFEWLDAPVRRYAAPDIPSFPFAAELEEMVYPNPEGIIRHAQELAKY